MTIAAQPKSGANQEAATQPLLQVRDLAVSVARPEGRFDAVRGVSFDLDRGHSLAIVGESGSGKTVTASTIAGLLPDTLVPAGSAIFAGEELIGMGAKRRRQLAGTGIGYIFQEPMSALHPIMPVGQQIEGALKAHFAWSQSKRRSRVAELLELVGLGGDRDIASQRIGQLSGGMRQRVMIAMALSCEPDLLVADEPTTALDVTLQRQVMDLLASLQSQLGLGLILITHDLAVVAETCEQVAVMYAGQLVETGPTAAVLSDPLHKYTEALLQAIPIVGDARNRLPTVMGTAPELRDERELAPKDRVASSLVEVKPGRVMRVPEGRNS